MKKRLLSASFIFFLVSVVFLLSFLIFKIALASPGVVSPECPDCIFEACGETPPGVCGDGTIDPGEACDPPAVASPECGGLECKANCTCAAPPFPACPDGICDVAGGECATCPADCTVADCCGNGVCDAAVGENSINCPADCALPGCPPCIICLPQCSDGVDNDSDGFIDFPADPQCADATDNDEANGGLPPADCEDDCSCFCPAEIPCPAGQCEGGLVPCGRSCDDPCTLICECAPCTLCHLFVLFKRIVDKIVMLYTFLLAVLMIVVGGIILQTASGDPGRITQGKKLLKAAIIGLVIILVAWLIVDTIITFVTPAGSPFQAWHTINCPVP